MPRPSGRFELNRNSPLANGLQLWLPLWDNTPTDMVGRLALTPTNGPSLIRLPERNGWQFTTASSQYLLSTTTPITTTPLSISCWFYPTQVAATKDLVSLANGSSTTDFFQLQHGAATGARARSGDSVGSSSATTATAVVVNTWQMGTAVFASSTSRIAYLNAGSKTSQSTSRSPTGISRVGVGSQVTSSPLNFYGGYIGNVCIWNRALSDDEITALYFDQWQLVKPIWRVFPVWGVSGTSIAVVETGAGADALALSVSFSATDTGNGADVPGGSTSLATADTGSASDTQSINGALASADSGSSVDALGSASNSLSAPDTGGSADVLAQVAALMAVLDAGSGADSPTITATLTIADAGSGLDSAITSLLIALSDSGSALDGLTSIVVTLPVIDSGSGADATTIIVTVSVADAGSVADAVSVAIGAITIALSDSGGGLDAVSIAASLTIGESASSTDATTATISLTLTDTGQAVDSVLVAHLIAVIDAATGSDAVGGSTITLAVSDTGNSSEAASVSATVSVAESATGSDAPVVNVAFGVTDTGIGLDTAALTAVFIALADSATGNESISGITASFAVADTARAVETMNMAAALAMSDVGKGLDVVINYGTIAKIVKITFTWLRRTMQFVFTQRSMSFVFAKRTMAFQFFGNEVG